MINKVILSLILAVFIVTPVFAKSQGMSLTATGYEWLGYSPEEKRVFANLIHIALDKNKSAYKTEDIIQKLDDFYYSAIKKAAADPLNFDENEYLKVRCVKVIDN